MGVVVGDVVGAVVVGVVVGVGVAVGPGAPFLYITTAAAARIIIMIIATAAALDRALLALLLKPLHPQLRAGCGCRPSIESETLYAIIKA